MLLLCVIFLLIGIIVLIIPIQNNKRPAHNNTPINAVCHIEHLDVFERIANEFEDFNFKLKAFKEDKPFEEYRPRKISLKKETKKDAKEKTKSK